MSDWMEDKRNPKTLGCPDCGQPLSQRTKYTDFIRGETPTHFGTCSVCWVRWSYDYGRYERCEHQGTEFDLDHISTWHLCDPMECPHYDVEGREKDPQFFTHYMHISDRQRDRMTHPLEATCRRCGATVGDFIFELIPMWRARAEGILPTKKKAGDS